MSDPLWAGDDLLPLTDHERACLELCALASAGTSGPLIGRVALTEEQRSFAESVDTRDGRWRLMFHDHAHAAPVRRGLLAFLAANYTPYQDREQARSGMAIQRRNGLLDILDAGFAAEDVTNQLVLTAEALVDQSLDAVTKGAVSAGKKGANMFANFHGVFGISGLIDKAADSLTGRNRAWDDDVDRYSHLVVAALALADCGDHDDVATIAVAIATELAEVSRELSDLRGQIVGLNDTTDPQLARLTSLIKGKERALRLVSASVSMLPAPHVEWLDSPDLTDVKAPDALRILEALGMSGQIKDNRQSRWIMVKANWTVERQDPAAGTATPAGTEISLYCRSDTDTPLQPQQPAKPDTRNEDEG